MVEEINNGKEHYVKKQSLTKSILKRRDFREKSNKKVTFNEAKNKKQLIPKYQTFQSRIVRRVLNPLFEDLFDSSIRIIK